MLAVAPLFRVPEPLEPEEWTPAALDGRLWGWWRADCYDEERGCMIDLTGNGKDLFGPIDGLTGLYGGAVEELYVVDRDMLTGKRGQIVSIRGHA